MVILEADVGTVSASGASVVPRDDGLVCDDKGAVIASTVAVVGAGMVVIAADGSVVGELRIDGFVYGKDGTRLIHTSLAAVFTHVGLSFTHVRLSC